MSINRIKCFICQKVINFNLCNKCDDKLPHHIDCDHNVIFAKSILKTIPINVESFTDEIDFTDKDFTDIIDDNIIGDFNG